MLVRWEGREIVDLRKQDSLSLRTSTKASRLPIFIPREVRKTTTRDRAFSVVASVLWNTLLVGVPKGPSFWTFRKWLRAELLEEAFSSFFSL